MSYTAGTTFAQVATTRKSNARVALFDLPGVATNLLSDCFHQFGIETLTVSAQDVERLRREKVDACVVPMTLEVASIIEMARASASNSRMVIYGLGGTARESMRYSKYCINAIFHEPLERSAALKLVRSTRSLVLHEFRRYVRVPVMTEVAVVTGDGGRLTVTSQEISTGGMSVKGTGNLEPGQMVEVSFALLTLPRIWVRGTVAWKKPNKTSGIRFDVSDERRQRLKDWIVAYLESA